MLTQFSGEMSEVNCDSQIDIEYLEAEEKDYYSGPAEYEITVYPADFTLEVLHNKWNSGNILIPEFQRDFVWKQIQSSRLIESFLLGLPVPAIYLYTDRETKKQLVVDGQQRLKSICFFFDGYFGNEIKGRRKIFRLKGLNEKSRWANKTYQELDESDQDKLKDCVLRSFIIQQLNPKDDTSIYHIFERLNTGGTILTNQEVRNCVYGGKLNDLLVGLNKDESWRKILGSNNLDRRQKDIELILRYFSLIDTKNYDKPLKDHMSRFMQKYRNPEEDVLSANRDRFKTLCKTVCLALGERPFHIKSGLSTPVFDSVMVAFTKHLHNIPDKIQERYTTLIENDEYLKLIRGATTDKENLINRFRLAEAILFVE